MKGAWRLTVPSSKRSNGNKNIGRLRAQARKQALAMAEVCRQENRENLRRATQITVAMGESKYRNSCVSVAIGQTTTPTGAYGATPTGALLPLDVLVFLSEGHNRWHGGASA